MPDPLRNIKIHKNIIEIYKNLKESGTDIQTLFFLSFFFQLKSESTNSSRLNSCKSSIFSPIPMYFTGILN